jgi:hypothetical protein
MNLAYFENGDTKDCEYPGKTEKKRAMLEVSQYLTSNCNMELKQ